MDGASSVEDSLSAHLQGATEVGADDVVGSVELRWHPVVVIRKAEPQATDAGLGDQAAQSQVIIWSRVPLRQYHDRPPTGAIRRREILAVDRVVLRMRRLVGAREA